MNEWGVGDEVEVRETLISAESKKIRGNISALNHFLFVCYVSFFLCHVRNVSKFFVFNASCKNCKKSLKMLQNMEKQ